MAKIEESLYNFRVTTEGCPERNYLYWNDNRIAECICGDYKKRFGGIGCWLKFIGNKRNCKRLKKINEIIKNLENERAYLGSLTWDIKKATLKL